MRPGFIVVIISGIIAVHSPPKVFAQAPAAGNPTPLPATVAKLSNDQLDGLVAPVALYPDAIIAHVLPAAAAPLDVVQAARYLRDHGGKIDKTPDNNWNTSVKVLMRFPDVLYKMDADLDWTMQLGSAVTSQLEDVMKAIQRVRSQAYAAGNLVSNDKQNVVVQEGAVYIEPSNPTVVYVPTYNPQTVVVNQGASAAGAAAIGFGVGVLVGAALADDDCDWHGCGIYHGPYYAGHYAYGHYNYHNLDEYWDNRVERPLDPRGANDPRGRFDPRGVADPRGRFDPRGRYDPRGVFDPRGRYDPRSPAATPYGSAGVGGAGVGRAGVGGQAGLGGGAAGVGRPGAANQAGFGKGAAGADRAGVDGRHGFSGGAAGGAGFGKGSAGARGFGGSGAGAGRSGGAGSGLFGSGEHGGYSRTHSASERGRQSLSGGRSSQSGRSSSFGRGRSGGSSPFSGRHGGGFGGDRHGGGRGGRR